METIQTADMSTTNQLEARNLALSFPGKTLLNATSLTIQSGMITSLQGRNGTGKSTLLRCLAGLHAPVAGEVMLNGTAISEMSVLERSRFIGALWTERVRIPGISVRDLVFMGTRGMDSEFGFSSPNLVESETNREVLRRSQKCVVLADHTKWGVRGFSSFASFEQADVVITDSKLPKPALARLNEQVKDVRVAQLR
jgi:ABC-type sugar transport system ATPase subunit